MRDRSGGRRRAIIGAAFALSMALSAVVPGVATHVRAQGIDAATLDREEQAARQAASADPAPRGSGAADPSSSARAPRSSDARTAESGVGEDVERDATPPKVVRYVVDEAGIIDPATEQALIRKLVEAEQVNGHQLVVVTTDSLGGEDVADYARKLGDSAGIGDKDRDDGVLFLIAPNERRMHIAIGYGLEATLTDAMAGRIIRDVVAPRFKQDDYNGGITAGVDAIAEIIALPPEEAAAQRAAAERQVANERDQGSGGALLIWAFVIFFFFVLPWMTSKGDGGRRQRHRGYDAPIIIWGGPGIGNSGGGGGFGGFGGGGGGGFGGFSGGGGSFGGGGASGGW